MNTVGDLMEFAKHLFELIKAIFAYISDAFKKDEETDPTEAVGD